ncbi:hypothetical protein BYT27DRAFT_7193869 [Phlegmacium glaucopus]|nr:hypothetical protein BYT27DRAFT_7193869 [Phlegmacium glaucopus]
MDVNCERHVLIIHNCSNFPIHQSLAAQEIRIVVPAPCSTNFSPSATLREPGVVFQLVIPIQNFEFAEYLGGESPR